VIEIIKHPLKKGFALRFGVALWARKPEWAGTISGFWWTQVHERYVVCFSSRRKAEVEIAARKLSGDKRFLTQ
jgi:hypothetical protein